MVMSTINNNINSVTIYIKINRSTSLTMARPQNNHVVHLEAKWWSWGIYPDPQVIE